MDRDNILRLIRDHESELRAAGVLRLALFGSTARGEDRPDSDVDLLAAFDPVRPLSLLDIVHLENRLSDILGRRVDLIEEGTLRSGPRGRVEQEAIRAF